jgi:hypothetical protein
MQVVRMSVVLAQGAESPAEESTVVVTLLPQLVQLPIVAAEARLQVAAFQAAELASAIVAA